jgi:hypothetical protein
MNRFDTFEACLYSENFHCKFKKLRKSIEMAELCRLCGEEKSSDDLVYDIKDEKIQETFRKCNVFIENRLKLCPQMIW